MQKQELSLIFKNILDQNLTEQEFQRQIEIQHLKAMRSLCNSLAQVGLGIIKDAQDTVWVTNFETAIDRIFIELGIDLIDDPEQQLLDFLNYEDEQWHEKILVKKSASHVQLELNLKS